MPRPDLGIQIAPGHPAGLMLRNPIMVAAGTFGWDGYGEGLPPGLDFQRLGAVVAKTTTLAPRLGNPPVRIVHGQKDQVYSLKRSFEKLPPRVGCLGPNLRASTRSHATGQGRANLNLLSTTSKLEGLDVCIDTNVGDSRNRLGLQHAHDGVATAAANTNHGNEGWDL